MAATLQEIREGLAANMAAVYTPDVTTSAYTLEQFVPPVIQVIGLDNVNYDMAFGRGVDEWHITIQGLVGPTLDQAAQARLDGWLTGHGATSVKVAIEADRTLGGKVYDTEVMSAGNYRQIKLTDGTVLLGCEWNVRVLNRGA
jgi:hypothetical protein